MSQVRSLQTGIKFKDTPIGKLPVDWEVEPLSDMAEIIMGQSPPSSEYNESQEGTPFYQGNADFGRKYPKPKQWCTKPLRIAKKGDILISVRAPVGDINIAPHQCCIGRGLGALRPVSVSSDFLYQTMLFYKHALERTVQGSTFGSINKKELSSFLTIYPPLKEQKKIAEILTTVDEVIEATDEVIEKARELRKGLTQTLFVRGIGHKKFKRTEIGEMPERWDVARLKSVARVRYGLGQPPALDSNGAPMIRATNINRGKIVKEGMIHVKRDLIPVFRNPYLQEGEIIVVRSGAYTGDVALVTKEWEGTVAGYDLVVTPSERIDPVFLTNYLLSAVIQQGYFALLKQRSAQPHLNSRQVEETPVPLPPLPEQKKIAGILSKVDLELENHAAYKQRLETLKKALMQVMLTGKVRVTLS